MDELTPQTGRVHQKYCAHPDPNHSGGCPIHWGPEREHVGTAVALRPDDPWTLPLEAEVVEPPAETVGLLDFHGVRIPVLTNARGTWASVTALCNAMGVDGEGQRQLLARKHWSEGLTCMTQVSHPGAPGSATHLFLHEKRVPMWLANIDTSRLRDPNVRARVESTQVEFADVLAEWVSSGEVRPRDAEPVSVSDALSKGFSAKDIALLVIAQSERAEAAEQRVAELTPAAQAHAAFEAAEGEYSMGTVAKILGTGQRRLFVFLRDHGVLINGGRMHNTPYQRYIDRGYFRVVRRSYLGDDDREHATHTTYARPAGLDFLRRLMDGAA